jgi:transcriptional regulator with GAF, ATPase, and Fis domain
MTEENKAILAPEGDSAFDLAVVDDAPFGTVFLDEFGELPLQVQAQVLRLIEYGEVQPLGYAGRVKLRDSKGRVHVRFIAATNHEGVRRLVASEDRGGISADGFRHDLVYRVSQWVVELMDLQADEVGSSVGDEGLLLKLERDDSDMKHVRWDAAAVLRLREEVIRGRVPGQRRQLRSIAMRAMAYAVEKEALGYPSELHGGSVVTKEVVEEALRPIRLAQPEAPGKMSPVDELHRCVCEMLRNEFGYEFNVGFEWAQVLRKFRNSRRTLCVAFLRSSQIILPSRGRWTLDELEKAWGNRGSVGAIRAVLKGELQGALKELIPSQGSPNETITWDEAIDLLSGQASESKVTGVSIADGLG